MATAAYSAAVKVGGVAVPVTGEACSFVSGTDPNKVYQVTSTSRRIWDPTAAVTVKDGGSTVAAANYSFNYLSGTVTFIGHAVTGAVTVDGSYLPTLSIAEVRKFAFRCMVDLLDKSNFDTGQARSKLAGLIDFDGSLELLTPPNADIDAGTGGVQSLHGYLEAGTAIVLEVTFVTGQVFRCWIQQDSEQVQAQTAGLIESSLAWKGSSQGAGATFFLGAA